MRTLALTAAMIAATAPTAAIAADWVYVTSSSTFNDYIDRGSIRTMPNGNKRAWLLREYENPNKFGHTSAKFLLEFDCREGRTRALQAIFLKGEEVTTTDNNASAWSFAPPESVAEGQLNYVCFGKLPG